MNRTLLSVAAAAMLGAVTASAQAPVRSEPANGATNVPVGIGVVRLHFDRDMRTDSYTVWTSRDGKFPPTPGDNTKPWRNSRLFELRIGKLEPNTTYALQLNSTKKAGFQSANGQPLPITSITFKTALVRPPADNTIGGSDEVDQTIGGEDKPDQTIGGGDTTLPGPAGMPQVGWRFDVKRHTLIDIVATGADGTAPMNALAKLAYVEEIKRVDQGKVAESTRNVSEASRELNSPDAPDGQTAALCPAGSAFRVRFQGDRGEVTTPDGKSAPPELAHVLSAPLRPDIFPAGALRLGQKWTYRDADVTRRLWFMQARGGSLELRVIRIADDKDMKLQVAQIVGRLRTKIQLDAMLLDFDAEAKIEVPIAIGIPVNMNFKGKLHGETEAPGTGGQTATYTIAGSGEFSQSAIPAKAIFGTLKPGALPSNPFNTGNPLGNPLGDPLGNGGPPPVTTSTGSASDSTFGYSKDNPIKLKGGSQATHAYLKTLCDTKGRGFRYRRDSSMGGFQSTEIYIMVDEDKKEHKLYVNPHGDKEPKDVPAPKGMQKGPGRSLRMSW